MVYGQISVEGIGVCHDYQSAARLYENTKPWARGQNFGSPERPLGTNRSTIRTVRMSSDGDVIFKLYHTDVVTHHKCGDITIEGWDSNSTDAFANLFLPDDLRHERGRVVIWPSHPVEDRGSWWTHRDLGDIGSGRSYRRNKTMMVVNAVDGPPARFTWGEQGWEVKNLDELPVFKRIKTNRKVAKEVIAASKINDFEDWCWALTELNVRFTAEYVDKQKPDTDALLDAVQEGEFMEALKYVDYRNPNDGQRGFNRPSRIYRLFSDSDDIICPAIFTALREDILATAQAFEVVCERIVPYSTWRARQDRYYRLRTYPDLLPGDEL